MREIQRRHSRLDASTVIDDRLIIGGVALSRLAQQGNNGTQY